MQSRQEMIAVIRQYMGYLPEEKQWEDCLSKWAILGVSFTSFHLSIWRWDAPILGLQYANFWPSQKDNGGGKKIQCFISAQCDGIRTFSVPLLRGVGGQHTHLNSKRLLCPMKGSRMQENTNPGASPPTCLCMFILNQSPGEVTNTRT